MATQYMTESRYPQMQQMQLPSGFSIVVDDVDGDQDRGPMHLAEEQDDADVVEEAQEAIEALPGPCQCGSSHDRRGSREPLDAQVCSERIRRIQVEAQSRKNEFAKLLEEHAQVVLRVKQMEQRELAEHAEPQKAPQRMTASEPQPRHPPPRPPAHPHTQSQTTQKDQGRSSKSAGGI